MGRYKKTDLAYAAGIIDADGCIHIGKLHDNRRKGRPHYSLYVKLAQTDNEAVNWISETFGGSVRSYFYKGKNYHGTKPMNIWNLYGQKAIDFLNIIKPYMKIKTKQIEIAGSFSKVRFFNNRSRRKGRFMAMPDDVMEQKEKFRVQMSLANQRRKSELG